MSNFLRITAIDHKPLGVLTCEGEVDAFSFGRLKEAADGLLDGGCIRLVFDLAGVTYMDSSGIRLLVECYHRLRSIDGTVELAGCNPTLLRILEITRLKPYFRLHDSVTAALHSMDGPPGILVESSNTSYLMTVS
jgi:anti-anti-sigma factor